MSRHTAGRPLLISLGLVSLIVAAALAAPAHAAQYKMVLCAGNVGSNAYGVSANTGIFVVENHCGPAPYPAGTAAFLRIVENQTSGNAGQGAYAFVHYDTPPYVHYKTAGAYTRQPLAFNDGWRARLWGVDFANQGFQIMTQGAGLCNCNGQWASSNIFGPHL